MTPLDLVLSRLPDSPRRAGAQLVVRCPVHQDKRPSLGLRQTDDGRLLMRCYAGCRTEDVLAALGLSWRDLFDR